MTQKMISAGFLMLLLLFGFFPISMCMTLDTDPSVLHCFQNSPIYHDRVDNGSYNIFDTVTDTPILQELTSPIESVSPLLKIEEITDQGHGITVTIKNEGSIDASDVDLDVTDVEGGAFVVIPKKHYEILTLSAGMSTSIQISIFGFGIGGLTDYAKFIFTINSPDAPTVVGSATAKVLGLFVNLISVSLDDDALFDGYTLFAPMWSTKTYLIDNSGEIVHSWNSLSTFTQAAYLLENGNLIRTSLVLTSSIFFGGAQGRFEMFDWNGNLVWTEKYSDENHSAHHDFHVLPNGNILIIAWEKKTAKEAINVGRNPNNIQGDAIWSDHIIEIEPTGSSGDNIVWEWHAWDHIIQDYDPTKDNYGVVADHPELIDINYAGEWRDWLHVNTVDYNEKFDQILIGSLTFGEIWVIDHSTTTNEAAGHTGGNSGKGGDLLYRWGNPQVYQAGDESDRKFFSQHDATWIKSGCPGEGNILVFNNGQRGPEGRYSSVDEIVPPVDDEGFYEYTPGYAYLPEEQIWIYTYEDPSDMVSFICSSAQRLPNGNTLICSATQGLFLEATHEKETIWEYYNPYSLIFINKAVSRIYRYALDYPGLNNLYR